LLGAVGAIAVVASGCGAANRQPSHAEPPAVLESSIGQGAERVWVFRPARARPRSVVLFFHGLGGQRETTPALHRPWLRHLAARGSLVLYPRFEVTPGAPRALQHALVGIRNAARKLRPGPLPVIAIGYSRGGGLVVDYAAVAAGIAPVPRAVLSIFPAYVDPLLDFRAIDPRTQFLFLVGDRDVDVRDVAARYLARLLVRSGHRVVAIGLVRSSKRFQATHLSVLEDSPGARIAFWRPADRLIARVRAQSARG
jgi:dienelactone hydrolase